MRNINIALTRVMCKDPDQFSRYDEIKRGNVNGMDENFLHNSLTVKKKKKCCRSLRKHPQNEVNIPTYPIFEES